MLRTADLRLVRCEHLLVRTNQNPLEVMRIGSEPVRAIASAVGVCRSGGLAARTVQADGAASSQEGALTLADIAMRQC